MNRIVFLDFVKFIAIYLVVFAHTVTYGVISDGITCHIHNVIYAFHMPLFAIVSGYFFKSNIHWKPFIKKKIWTLLYPIIFWAFIYSIFILRLPNDISSHNFHMQAYLRDFLIAVKDMGWFLKALFLCYVSLNVCMAIKNMSVAKTAVTSVILLYILALTGAIPNKCHIIENFIFLYPFFVTGFFFKHFAVLEKANNLYIYSLFVFVVGYAFFWKHAYCFYSTNTSFFAPSDGKVSGVALIIVMLFRYLMGVSGSYFVILAIKKLIEKFRVESYREHRVVKMVLLVGQSSLAIYLIQDIALPLLKGHIVLNSEIVSLLVANFIALILCVTVAIFVQAVSKNKFLSRLMWGK